MLTGILGRPGRAVAAAALILTPPAALAADSVNAAPGLAARSAASTTAPAPARLARGTLAAATPTSGSASQGAAPSGAAATGPGAPPRQLIVPDLAAVVPAGASPAQVAAIGKLPGVRAVLAVAGGRVRVGGPELTVLGVPLPAFRSWTPPVTAAASGTWAALDNQNMVASSSSAAGLAVGSAYQVLGRTTATMLVTASVSLGIPGVDAIVTSHTGTGLGLTPDAVILVNAPGADDAGLTRQISAVLGTGGTVVSLVPVAQVAALPVTHVTTTGRPSTWLGLYQESAALYCPGLSWTVLAAIGEIESGDGANVGPSPAGALGPMQFMPATWATWATTGFGGSGPPDIMNPLDAVPSAARLLCADGAGSPTGLSAAIYDYNHATWYVSEVLDLAAEYAREYQ